MRDFPKHMYAKAKKMGEYSHISESKIVNGDNSIHMVCFIEFSNLPEKDCIEIS